MDKGKRVIHVCLGCGQQLESVYGVCRCHAEALAAELEKTKWNGSAIEAQEKSGIATKSN